MNNDIISLLISLFNINSIKYNNINISCIVLNKKSNILINEKNNDNIILSYKINNENYFQLEYIFDYNDRIYLNSGLLRINNDYEKYFKNNLNFKENFKNDYISPIFQEKGNDIVGYCYKYYYNNIII